MMRVLVFCAGLCVLLLHAEVRCLPLVDVKQAAGDCGPDDVTTKTGGAHTGCDVQETDDVLNAKERHEGLLRELQELAEHESDREQEYTRDRDDGFEQKDTDGDENEEWEDDDEDNDERVMKKEKNERDLEELLGISDRTQDDGEEKMESEELMMEVQKVKEELKLLLEAVKMNDTQSWNREREKEQKQEELQELLRKMSRAKNQTQQKREMENASDEATRQFEGERDRRTEEDEDEELLEIEVELRKVAAELRELHRG